MFHWSTTLCIIIAPCSVGRMVSPYRQETERQRDYPVQVHAISKGQNWDVKIALSDPEALPTALCCCKLRMRKEMDGGGAPCWRVFLAQFFSGAQPTGLYTRGGHPIPLHTTQIYWRILKISSLIASTSESWLYEIKMETCLKNPWADKNSLGLNSGLTLTTWFHLICKHEWNWIWTFFSYKCSYWRKTELKSGQSKTANNLALYS